MNLQHLPKTFVNFLANNITLHNRPSPREPKVLYIVKVIRTNLLQNHTLTTSFSIERLSASIVISSEVGLGFWTKARSRATRTLVSMEVRFLRRRPTVSGELRELVTVVGSVMVLSASVSHFCKSGLSLHMFLKERLRASNLLMVVWEKSLPYSLPMASPTSPCVNPNLIRRCLKVLANCSSSSRSVGSSGRGSQ